MNRRLEAERAALDGACEDSIGLYEVDWMLNSNMPDVDPIERRQLARDAVRSLVLRGLVDVLRRGSDGVELLVQPEHALSTVSSEAAWRVPGHGREEILIYGTDAGLKLLLRSDRPH